MVPTIAVVLTAAEVLLLTAAFVLILQDCGYERREAFPLGLVLSLALLSLLAQWAFLLRHPELLPVGEAAFAGAATAVIRRLWEKGRLLATATRQARDHRRTWLVLAFPAATLFALALLVPEGNSDSMRYNLARVLLFEQERSLFPEHFSEFHQVVLPVGGDLLRHYILRFHTDVGVALFNLAAIVAVASAAYAGGRLVANRPAAVTATWIVATAPLFVFQATGTKPDLLLAAVAAVALVVGERIARDPRGPDLLILAVLLAFGIAVKTTFLAFAAPLGAASLAGLAWPRSSRAGGGSIGVRWWLASVMAGVLITPLWLFAHNWARWGHWAGPPTFVAWHTQPDGLKGTAANFVRYAVQSVHVLTPIDLLAERMCGRSVSATLQAVYNQANGRAFAHAGIAVPRLELVQSAPRWGDGENGAFFGPLGFLIVGPACLFSIARGRGLPRRAGGIAVACTLLICAWVAWMPWNGRFLAMPFGATGPCVAWTLQTLSTRTSIQRALRAVAIAILYYGCCFNKEKDLVGLRPLVDLIVGRATASETLATGILPRTHWGRDRDFAARRHFGDDRVALVSRIWPSGARVALVTGGATWIFPFLQRRPDVHFIPLRPRAALAVPADYMLCVDVPCPPRAGAKEVEETLWVAGKDARLPGELRTLQAHGPEGPAPAATLP
jgi:hypothetical protein